MADNLKSGLRFINYQVNDVEFHLNNDYVENSITVDFNIERFVEYKDDDENTMYVTLILNIFEHAKEKNFPFSMNLDVTGIFQLDNIDIDKRESFAEVNSVAILFPYLRSLVSTYTANSNVPALILPPINVVKLIENQENMLKERKN
ncbi:protein-export chaperone SecB [Paenisporosarcina sp. TG20]|uniref:protein-export chaperone SecB n=1 Tax=Paenisporosarcina sp. TG20 TaxID=1211706 RepID=UPI00030AB7A8|nr:protein-export chaperone SecB [Paenisporosarcina sp. TG20]